MVNQMPGSPAAPLLYVCVCAGQGKHLQILQPPGLPSRPGGHSWLGSINVVYLPFLNLELLCFAEMWDWVFPLLLQLPETVCALCPVAFAHIV